MNKFFDNLFPVLGAAGGSLLSHVWETALTAVIFALVGGLVGYGLKIILDHIFKKKE